MLTGRTILVTGAFGLIGSGMTRRFSASGAKVLRATRDKNKADNFNNSQVSGTTKAVYIPLDDEQGLKDATKALIEEHGRLDGLVNNAYPVLDYTPVGHTPWSHWRKAAEVTLAAAETLSAMLVEQREATHISSIVNIASIYGRTAPQFGIYLPGQEPSAAYYGAMKAGLIALSRYHAVLWAPLNVRVNSISPGGIEAEQNLEFLRRYGGTVPMQRMVTAEEVAAVAGFLLGAEASGVTGTDTVVDGGKTAW